MMKLYRTTTGLVLETDEGLARLHGDDWDALLNADDPEAALRMAADAGEPVEAAEIVTRRLLPPIGTQEVWAAGVTYFRSREARMEESRTAGGGDFYDRVYTAPRPELFFKATPARVVGPGAGVRIRRDARWSVPEPELALVVNSVGRIVGFTIGNDMSARDIEGENPLYLPQAKVYAKSCALGPAVLLGDSLPDGTPILLGVMRQEERVFQGETTLAAMKRKPEELVEWLYRESYFPTGCVLLTGTGIVPPDDFTLAPGDVIRIEIPPIGVLENVVEVPAPQ